MYPRFHTKHSTVCKRRKASLPHGILLTAILLKSLVGNFAASKVHLNGLITMLEIQRLQSKKGTHLNLPEHSEYANHEEIAERHAMISFDFTTGLKTHRHEVERGQFSIKGHRVDTRKGTWKKDFMGHDERLTAMLRTLRFFSIPEIEAQTRRIDARSSIEALRRTTKLVDQGLSPYDPSVTTSGPVWTFGSSALMMVSEGDPFGESGASQDDGERPLLTSRSCLDVACGFYMYGILGVGNGDGAVESRFTRQVFEILKRDVSESEQDLMSGLTDQNFWLWKVVVGAHGLALMELQSQFMANGRLFDMIAGGQSTVRMLKAWFYGQFRLWSRMTGVNEYSGVRKALLQISWPEKSFVREAIIEKSWDEALNTC